MVEFESLRRFLPYGIWSERAITFWNDAIRAKARIHQKNLDESLSSALKTLIHDLKLSLNIMCDAIRRARFENIPIDPIEITEALSDRYTPYRFFVAEGITFETICANLNMLLDDAVREMELVAWKSFIYTFTYVATSPIKKSKKDALGKVVKDAKGNPIKERIERKLEIHFESELLNSSEAIEEVQKKVPSIAETLVRRSDYGFIFDEPNIAEPIESWTFGPDFEKTGELVPTKFEIYDHSYSTVRAIRRISLPLNWWELTELQIARLIL